jgi:hypothetical protein
MHGQKDDLQILTPFCGPDYHFTNSGYTNETSVRRYLEVIL